MTQFMEKVQARDDQAVQDFKLMTDAMELLVELWPSPGYASVVLESHQWQRLRPILSSMSRLWVEAYQ